MTIDKLVDAIEYTVTLLDERLPGWWNEIDLDRLDMGSLNYCVGGQLNILVVDGWVFPETPVYDFAEEKWNHNIPTYMKDPIHRPHLAFLVWRRWFEDERMVDKANEVWTREINKRLNNVT